MNKLNDLMYVIRGNRKHNLFIGFTHKMNLAKQKIEYVSQNDLEFALYFNSKADAEKFKATYFENTDVKEYNKQFYEAICVKAEDIDSNIFMYNVPCYFSKTAWLKWISNPSAFIKKLY